MKHEREMLGASGSDAPFILKFSAGALSGSTGSMIGNPFDVMKTMMMANCHNFIIWVEIIE